MGQGYTRQKEIEISPDEIITAEDLEAEFDAIQAFAHGTSGHSHDGTTGEGPKISLTTSITGILPVANGGVGGINKTDATTAPTVNEDENDNYVVGSRWINLTDDAVYTCTDSSVGAAVWVRHQPYDVDLTAIAALTSAANKVPYATGSGTWALADFSAFARTFLDDANAAAVQTTLGLVPGTNVQTQNANLQAIAGLTSAADKGVQFTGSGTASTYDLTAFAKTMLDDADASAVQTTLGMSTFFKTLLDDADATTFRSSIGAAIGTNVQAYDAGLAALAAYNTNGFLVQTADNTFTGRTITVTAPITVSNGNGVSGDPLIGISAASTSASGAVELATDAETITGTDTARATTPASVKAALDVFLPAGITVPYAGSSAPTGWLLCYGQAVSRTTYAALFTAISTTYGSGDGSSTFNLPDLRGRVIAGEDDMGGSSANRLTNQTGGLNGDTLGATGGSETHTLTAAQMPSHTHAAGTLATSTTGAHTHTMQFNFSGDDNPGGGNNPISTSGGNGGNINPATHISANSNGDHSHTITGSTASAGSDGAHNNVQPTIILTYIIKT